MARVRVDGPAPDVAPPGLTGEREERARPRPLWVSVALPRCLVGGFEVGFDVRIFLRLFPLGLDCGVITGVWIRFLSSVWFWEPS